MDQEPPCININLVCGGMSAAVMMASPMFDSFIAVDAEGRRFPQLATEIPTTDNGGVTLQGDQMTVSMGIQPTAAWSDGKPITCEDFKFTWETFMDDKWQVGSRLGWDKIKSVDCPDERKIVVTFLEPYAPYLQVMGSSPLPAHELKGKDFNTFWNDRITVGSGPFKFKHWKRSVEYVLERNPNYWNKGKNDLPYLDTLTYRFLKDTNTLKIQLRTGEVDWITPPPDTSLMDELKGMPRSKFQTVPGGYWEQFAFNTAAGATKDVNVRKAIAHSIDRQQLTEVVLRKQTTPLNSTLLPAAKAYYVPAWEEYGYDEKKVTEYLTKAGYKKGGEYWEKGGKELTVVFKSTAGNALREKVAQLLQQAFKDNGIKMELAFEPPAIFFGQSTIQGKFDVADWAWSSGVDPTQTTLFACDQIPTKEGQYAGNNYYQWCNKEATALMHKADATPDLDQRAEYTHQIQKLMADDMPLLPLYQRPETVAYSNRLQGVVNNPLGGQQWNIAEWWVTAP